MAVLANVYTPAATFISPRKRVILREKIVGIKHFITRSIMQRLWAYVGCTGSLDFICSGPYLSVIV